MVNIIPRLRLYNLVKIYGEVGIVFGNNIAAFLLANSNHLKVYSLEPNLKVIRPL